MRAVPEYPLRAVNASVVVLLIAGIAGAAEPASFDDLLVGITATALPELSLDGAVNDELSGYLAVALLENPTLRQRYAEYTSAQAAIATVTSLPDPRVGITEYLAPVETRVGPQRRALSVSQSFPWFGSLGARGGIKGHEAAAARSVFESTVLEIAVSVKQAYFDLGYLAAEIAITERHHQLLSQWEDVAQARYSAGTGQYADLIRAQVELGVLGDRLVALRDEQLPLAATLNALLNRAPDQPVILGEIPELDPRETELARLTELLVQRNPALVAWYQRAESSLAAERAARLSGRPTFTVGLNYIQTDEARQSGVADSGDDAFMASLAISLPIWRGRVDAEKKVATGRYEAAVSGRRDLANQLTTALAREHYRYKDAVRRIALYETTLLPKGRQSLGATRAAYEAGNSSFGDLMSAERLLLEFELSQARARFDGLIHEAVIDQLVAGPWGGTGASP